DPDHQRRVEPAAVLVRTLEVDDPGRRRLARFVERPLPGLAQRRVRDLDRAMRGARVEPHVEDVGLLPERPGRAAMAAREAFGPAALDRQLVPGVRAVLARDLGGRAHDVVVEVRLAARLAVDRRDPDAPGTLA